MPIGPGKYDEHCTRVREATEAKSVILIVIGGKLGNGFDVQSNDIAFGRKLPALLRSMADDIERDMMGGMSRN